MKGLVIGGMGIVHVFLAQFAVGGGILMVFLERRARRGDERARAFLAGFFKVLVLISFVLGALTGVGMWFTSIQVSPQTIGLMVSEFHWIWAAEWVAFCVEVVAGYAYYRCGPRLDERSRGLLIGVYAVAAWLSLFLINGILSWQLTPGEWIETRSVWAGFFNPGFWPSLLFRTVVSMTLAALVACAVVNFGRVGARKERRELIHTLGLLLLPMAGMPLLGLWYLATMPDDSRAWILGGSAAMTMFLALAVGASLLIGLYAVFGIVRGRLYVNGATSLLLLALAFAATAAGEFVREGARKPYTVRDALYSTGLEPGRVAELRVAGSVADDPWPLTDAYPTPELELGARVLRAQCSICHTVAGVNGLEHLTGSWSLDQLRLNLAKLQHTKAFMPPFAGTPEELEALVQLLDWNRSDRPASWVPERDGTELERIAAWLDEAGTEPGGPR